MIEINEVTNSEKMKDALFIRKKVFIEEQKVPKDLEMDGNDDKCLHFVLYLDQKPVATCRLRLLDRAIKLQRVATLQEVRGKGLAKQLMEYIQKLVIEKYPDFTLKTHAQILALPFYEKLGWNVVSKSFFEAGIEHVEMIFPIAKT